MKKLYLKIHKPKLLIIYKIPYANFNKNFNNITKKKMIISYKRHYAGLQKVIQLINEFNYEYEIYPLSYLNFYNNIDKRIVITVGGDGTLLITSHYIKNNPILGFNSDIIFSQGLLCACNINNLKSYLLNLKYNKIKKINIIRMSICINGQFLPYLPLNDILLAHRNPASMSEYKLYINNSNEFHRSSGIWICTPIGATGSMQSAGGVMQALNEKRLQLIIREPYYCKNKNNIIFIKNKEHIKIITKMSDGNIFIDGSYIKFNIPYNSIIIIKIASNKLQLIASQEMIKKRWNINRNTESGT